MKRNFIMAVTCLIATLLSMTACTPNVKSPTSVTYQCLERTKQTRNISATVWTAIETWNEDKHIWEPLSDENLEMCFIGFGRNSKEHAVVVHGNINGYPVSWMGEYILSENEIKLESEHGFSATNLTGLSVDEIININRIVFKLDSRNTTRKIKCIIKFEFLTNSRGIPVHERCIVCQQAHQAIFRG